MGKKKVDNDDQKIFNLKNSRNFFFFQDKTKISRITIINKIKKTDK